MLLIFVLSLACVGADAQDRSREPFAFKPGDVAVFIGGASVVAAQENACLETILTLNLPAFGVRFRNMGWEADTVFEQRRDLNFGPWSQQFKRVGATVIIAQFGQMESLRGIESLPAFVAAYDKLLDEFAKRTERIVMVSPFPFEKTDAPLPDLTRRNDDLGHFADAIHQLSRKRGHHFVDLFTPFQQRGHGDFRMTSDGFSLNPYGHWITAVETSKQLGLGPVESHLKFEIADGTLLPPSAEQLRQAILAKNRYWFDYWRPMNWAFLRGDRTEQPSSRDHRDPKIRWFPEELEKFMPLIDAREREIAAQAGKFR